jgi:arylsulfatase A-like enzyme
MKKFFFFITSLAAITTYAAEPNIVFIFTDDMGWTGTSVEMIKGNPETKSDFYQTPNLEKLAAQGMRFSNAYSPAALCTPSRAAVLTGKTPAELHITTPGGGGRTASVNKLIPARQLRDLPADEITIAEALKNKGYVSAHFGKWHIGRGNPGEHGFDEHDGPTGNESDGTESNPKDIFGITDRAIEFMTRQTRAKKPFYLQLAHYAVHSPNESLAASIQKFEKLPEGKRHNQADYAGMTWDLDASIGTLFETIDHLGIMKNTYVVFMSDNGAAGGRRTPHNTPLNKGKGTLYEGGIRVPLIIKGPGIPANSCSGESVTGCDLFPTFCEWAGIPAGNIDGSSITPLLTGQPDLFKRSDPVLLFHYPHYGQGSSKKPQSAIIADNYKLLKDYESNTYQLFNLENDIGEKNDLSKSMADKVKELTKLMNKRLKEVDAQLPTENPDYDPSSQQSNRRKRRR